MKRNFLLFVAEIGLTLTLLGCSDAESKVAAPSASAGAQTAKTQATPLGNGLLRESITRLESQQWVSARLRFRLQLFGRNVQGEGRYLQGPRMKMRLELKTLFTQQDEPAVLLQVYDGKEFWEYRDILGERQVTKISRSRVFEALRKAQADGTDSPVQFLGLGGLPQLLRTLEAEFAFSQPQAQTQQGRAEVLLVGQWKPAALQDLLLPRDRQKLQPSKLPWHIPNQAELLFDRETLFPRQIRFARTVAGSVGEMPSDAEVLGEKVFVEFFDLRFDEPVSEEAFVYQPSGEVPITDKTQEYLQRLGLSKHGE